MFSYRGGGQDERAQERVRLPAGWDLRLEEERLRALTNERIGAVRLMWSAWERDLDEREREIVRDRVVGSGFPPREEAAPGRLWGLTYQGHTYGPGDRELTGTLHYLDHAVRERQWPDGTSEIQYYRDIEAVVFDESSRMFVSWFRDEATGLYRPQLGIIGQTDEDMRGPGGASELIVEYRLDVRGWATAFQLEDAERRVRYQEAAGRRRNLRWQT